MSSFIRRICRFGPLMRDMVVSATGCFALMRGFRLVASPMAGIGAALFLLAFVASEAAATVVALHR